MVDQIEMALDDNIKENKKTPRGGGGAGRKFNATIKPMGARGGSGAGDGFRNHRVGGVLRGTTRDGISKAASYTRGDVNSAWKHDMFNNYGERKIQRNAMPSITTGPSKLLVSNLDFGVSDADIQELFSVFGILKSAAVNYDRSGRSLGTAEVVFERKADAFKAVKQYNGELLDGRAINIQLATSEISTFRTAERSQNGSVRNGGGSGPMRRNMNGGGANRSQGGGGPRGNAHRCVSGGRGEAGDAAREKRPVPTAEQLDAELDAYMKQKQIKRNISDDKCCAKETN